MISRWTLSVVPSICESFCIAALESAAMGVPIVAAHVGGLRETVLHDETGLLVPPADPDALAGAIIDLLCNDGRRCRLAANGRPFVAARFEWEKCMDAWEAFFHDADRRTQQSVYAPC
jgi:glycosyltransferase involved in cell wall biosynthesis